MSKLQSIEMSLRTADDWERKEQPGWVSKCVSSALMNYLSLAVEEHGNIASAVTWLTKHHVVVQLKRFFSVCEALAAEVDAGCLPNSVIAGNYPYIVFAHMSWALQEWEIGESYVAFANRNDVLELSTPFWREFARAMSALVAGEAYVVPAINAEGLEEYWLTYLQLIEAATNGKGVDDAIATIDVAFVERNTDKSIHDDSYQIEGSGNDPVRWDFRRDSLLAYIRRENPS